VRRLAQLLGLLRPLRRSADGRLLQRRGLARRAEHLGHAGAVRRARGRARASSRSTSSSAFAPSTASAASCASSATRTVWALLSDGRLPPALSLLGDIESSIAEAAFDAERAEASDAKLRFKLRSWEAQELQRNLKLDEPLMEIMAWTPEQIQERLRAFARAASSNGRPTTAACSSSSAAISTRCTRTSPPAWTTATAMPTPSTRSPAN
jgi:cell division protease FtsH